jgi:uncharacterized protein (TIGR04255 family)
LFERIERLGLRYVNFFENLNICDHSTLRLEVRNISIAKQSITLRTETDSKGFKVITQISNCAQAQVAGELKSGSILDLDIVKPDLNVSPNSLTDELMHLFKLANEIADSTFFNFLADDFIVSFEPEY